MTTSAIAKGPEVDFYLLEQYDEQENGFKLELYNISHNILFIKGNVTELTGHEASISKIIFDTCLQIRQLLHSPAPIIHRKGIKLPKIDVPMFDGDIMNWRYFWEQYEVFVHSRSYLTHPKRLAYL